MGSVAGELDSYKSYIFNMSARGVMFIHVVYTFFYPLPALSIWNVNYSRLQNDDNDDDDICCHDNGMQRVNYSTHVHRTFQQQQPNAVSRLEGCGATDDHQVITILNRELPVI